MYGLEILVYKLIACSIRSYFRITNTNLKLDIICVVFYMPFYLHTGAGGEPWTLEFIQGYLPSGEYKVKEAKELTIYKYVK